MSPFSPAVIEKRLQPIIAALRTATFPVHPRLPQPTPPLAFVTISRETGAGAWTLAGGLVERLNHDEPQPPLWTCWDRELVEKVASDHHLSKELIESLEEVNRSWFQDFVAGLSFHGGDVDGFKAYRRVAETIRALAQIGHVVIVGRGGVFITRDLPCGVHVRLVAPLAYRIAELARRANLSPGQAAAEVRHKDAARRGFYGQYWPQRSLGPESFTITLNSAVVSTEQAVDCLIPLIRSANKLGERSDELQRHAGPTHA